MHANDAPGYYLPGIAAGGPRWRAGGRPAVLTRKCVSGRGQGIEVKDRGRIPAGIVAQYREATTR